MQTIQTHFPTLSRDFRNAPSWSEIIRTTVVEWRRRVRQRQELMMLTDRDFADMRMTRSDAIEEARKPFWLR